MSTHKISHRVIATFFLLVFFPTLFPIHVYASNNGPVAPESTSFEPVDATDMVNLVSGDMAYVLPLLNVPSPEGGYSVSLANHAGIAIDQEASWVGLGWNLNPGAINRGIAGVPDDWKQSKMNQIYYDAGGQMKNYSGSISIGWAEMYSVGIYGSYSENKTIGGTTAYDHDGGVQASVMGVTARIGSDGLTAGMGLANKSGMGIAVTQSFKDGSTDLVVMAKYNGVGISYSTQNKFSGATAVGSIPISGNNYSTGGLTISTQTYSGSFSFPVYAVTITVGLGYTKARYWTYDNTYTKHTGSLYAGNTAGFMAGDLFPETINFDSYNSIYKLQSDEQLDQDNLSSVAYDTYSVSGQGISGTIKPALYQQGNLIGNYKEGGLTGSIITYLNGLNNAFTKTVNNNDDDIHFYFDNEQSSYLRIASGGFHTMTNPFLPIIQMTPGTPLTPNDGSVVIDGITYNGYNNVTQRKKTGSFIETFTNAEITAGTKIIKPENFNRADAPAEGIGAFRITALDGKVYHYSLPVYQKQKNTKSTNVGYDMENHFFEQQQFSPYATHWLLTAVTGPDYVDVNQNDMVDQDDYGYWAAFDYGKWSNGYVWSTPVKSNDKVKSYQWGVKEMYYLDKIKTRTHTAVFIKEDRQDDLSYTAQVGSENNLAMKNDVNRQFIKDKNGNYNYKGIYENYMPNLAIPITYSTAADYLLKVSYGQFLKFNKHKTLRLKKILLMKNADIVGFNKNRGAHQPSAFRGQIKYANRYQLWNSLSQSLDDQYRVLQNADWLGEFYNNIYDTNDLSGSDLESKAVKSIRFDYAITDLLAKNSNNSDAIEKGRLTLTSVNFIGRNNTQLIPPYKFNYINNVSYDATKEDNWGYYKNYPEAWSLNKITTPTGAQINIQYEADDIDKEAVPGLRGWNGAVKFSFYQYNGKLRINVQNENGGTVNFQDFFQNGSPTMLDLWVSFRRDIMPPGGWISGGCESRRAAVDVNSNVSVVGVTPTLLTLETSMSAVYDADGVGDLMTYTYGLTDYDGEHLIRVQNAKRGGWGNPPGCVNTTNRFVLTYNLYGNKTTLPLADKTGGGIRVKEINVSEMGVKRNITRYFYNVPGYGETKTSPNYKSSGITSYVPQKYFKEIKYITEVPAPSVMYQYVTVRNYSTDNQPGVSEEYNFDVLMPDTFGQTSNDLNVPNAISITKEQEWWGDGQSNGESYRRYYSQYKVKDIMSYLGRLREKKTYNSNNHLLSVVRNNYKSESNTLQGVSEESFNTYKRVSNESSLGYRLSVSSRTKLASLLQDVTTISDGFSNKMDIVKYDFLTGNILESTFTTGDGQVFKNKVVPAYSIPNYSEMGSKSVNIANRNMMAQTAANYTYILDKPSSTWKETGVGITTWNNIWWYKEMVGDSNTPSVNAQKIWRKSKTYAWNGLKDINGIFSGFNSATHDNFDWAIGVGQPVGSKWKQMSQVTLYDHYSMPLEIMDISGNYTTTKMGNSNSQITATGNARYTEIYYAGAENNGYFLEPEVRIDQGAVQSMDVAHTGRFSVKSTANSQFGVFMRSTQHSAGKYKLSVWVHKDNAANARFNMFNASNPVLFNGESYQAGNWVLKTHYFDVSAGDSYPFVSAVGNNPVYFDDLMIRPLAVSAKGYVYNEWDELTHIIFNNGLATKYEYDQSGRLIKTYLEVFDDTANGLTGGFKLTTENKMKYKNL